MHLPHFELIYDAQYQTLADDYAKSLENSFRTLSPLYETFPEKTAVVLNDNSDLTNGFATVIPYPMIQSFPVLPSSQDSIGEYGHWSEELLMHEYTHILASYQKRGVFSTFSHVFGSLMSPNILLPRWWHEGLAVETETRYSHHGRLRSAQQDAWLRNEVLAAHLNEVGLAEANEVNIPTWPYGARPYLFGSLFWSQAISEKSTSAKDLATAHGGRVPFFLNAPSEDILGKDYNEFYNHAIAEIQTRAMAQLSLLRAAPTSKPEFLKLSELESQSPTISPDGLKLAFISKDETTRRSLEILQRPNPGVPFSKDHLLKTLGSDTPESAAESRAPLPHDGPVTGTLNRMDWSPDSKRIVFDKVDVLDRYHLVSDLYIYDIEKRKTEPLSHGLRAREPAFSRDGKKIVFVQLAPGQTRLGLLDLESKSTQIVYEGEYQERCSFPLFLSDHEVLFQQRKAGAEKLVVLNLENRKLRSLFESFPETRFPALVKGRLLFTSTKNGVPNLYLASNDLNSARPVTHSETGIFMSTWDDSQKDLYVTTLDNLGSQVARIPGSASANLPKELPSVKPLLADRYPQLSKDEVPVGSAPAPLTAQESTDYSAGSYLWPKYWYPFYYWDAYSSYLSASTSASDPLGKHAWTASLNYDLSYGRLGYLVSYNNNSTSVEIDTLATDFTYQLPGNIPERTQYVHAEGEIEVPSLSPYFYWSVGASSLVRTLPAYGTSQYGPTIGFRDTEYKVNGAQISPESGWGASALATAYLAGSGNTSYNQLELSFVKYWSGFLPKRHVIMAKIQSFLTDQSIPASNFATTLSLPYYQNTSLPQYLMRAYPTGEFEGRILNQLTLEYRFPVRELNQGTGTSPLFFRRLYGAVVADGVELDGIAYDLNSKVYRLAKLSNSYWDIGAEAKVDTTLGYLFPITWYLGVYQPLEQSLGNSFNFAFGVFL